MRTQKRELQDPRGTALRRPRPGFSLIELLAVVAIMGLLGGVAVGGYRAMVRTMEERGVVQNVNSFVSAAYQRAQIDRQPVLVYFWNETLRVATSERPGVYVGKAVAVRRSGRLTRVNGGLLVDEFADWITEDVQSGSDNEAAAASAANARASGSTIALYAMDRIAGGGRIARAFVHAGVEKDSNNLPQYLETVEGDGEIKVFGYRIAPEDKGAVSWEEGMAYGFEVMRLELPAGYVFGSSKPSDSGETFVDRFSFAAGQNSNNGLNTGGVVEGGTIAVSAVRQKGQAQTFEKIATSTRPDTGM